MHDLDTPLQKSENALIDGKLKCKAKINLDNTNIYLMPKIIFRIIFLIVKIIFEIPKTGTGAFKFQNNTYSSVDKTVLDKLYYNTFKSVNLNFMIYYI